MKTPLQQLKEELVKIYKHHTNYKLFHIVDDYLSIEKEVIINAFDDGVYNVNDNTIKSFWDGKDYFEEKFKE